MRSEAVSWLESFSVVLDWDCLVAILWTSEKMHSLIREYNTEALYCKQQPYKSALWHLHYCIKLKLLTVAARDSVWLPACVTLCWYVFLLTAAGACRGQARCAGQGRGHATSRSTASPHTVPTATAPRYAGCQQSGALGTFQEHSTYTSIINLTVPPRLQ